MHSGRDLALGDSFYWANYVAAARRGNGVTDLALVRGYHQTSGIRAERAFDGGGLDGVVLGGRGAVRRDVVHLLGGKGGLPQSNRNGLRFGAAIRGRIGQRVGIQAGAIARELGVDTRAAQLGALESFQHHRAAAFAHHEAVALPASMALTLPRRTNRKASPMACELAAQAVSMTNAGPASFSSLAGTLAIMSPRRR